VAEHRVLPDPALSVAFCCRRAADGRVDAPRLLVVGPKTRPHACSFAPEYEMVAVRLKLEWAALVLDLVPADHRDALDDLSLVRPHFAAALHDALAETRTHAEAAALLVAAVGREARRGHALRPAPMAAAYALDTVRRTAGRLPVERVAGQMGISVRYLRRVVRRDAGVSLKAYGRTVRLLHAVAAADRSPDPAWARIAADSGFCDQSHLVRECRALCGMAPGEVHRERRAEDRNIQSPVGAVA